MKHLTKIFCISFICCLSYTANAHHSFAIYDLENKTEIKGLLTDVKILNPHIIFSVEVEDEDEQGEITLWRIESMNPNRWRSFDFPEADSIAEIGEEVSILGWKARNGDTEMALGSIITDDGEVEIRDRIRQGQGRGMGGMAGVQEGQ